MPRVVKFVTLLNSQRRPSVDLWLLGPPEEIELHWTGAKTEGCVLFWLRRLGEKPLRSLCPHCAKGVEARSYFYAPVVILSPPDLKNEGKRHPVDAIIQFPLALVTESSESLTRGRRVRARELGEKKRRPSWELLELVPREKLPEAFDLADALRRMKGPSKLPTLRRAEPDDPPFLRGPWADTA